MTDCEIVSQFFQHLSLSHLTQVVMTNSVLKTQAHPDDLFFSQENPDSLFN